MSIRNEKGDTMKLGIIGAMTLEVEALQYKLLDMKVTKRAGRTFCEGVLQGLPVVVVVCGVGKVNAALCVQLLRDLFDVTHILNTGIAGSLEASLDIGDIVVSTDAMYHDFDCGAMNYTIGQVPKLEVLAFPADGKLIEAAKAACDAVYPGHSRTGRVASGDQFVCRKEQKEAIIQNTGAICTEMEGAAIAHAAYLNGLPFVILRAISDKADESVGMDYPTFEREAALRSAAVTEALAAKLAQEK